jgi:isopenicillin N synthase-like dioxygenase
MRVTERSHRTLAVPRRVFAGHTGRVVPPPVIDISALRATPSPPPDVVAEVDAACTEIGFFVVTGHGIESQVEDVFGAARALFALPEATKEAVAMVDRQGFVPARHLVVDRDVRSAPAEYFDVGTRGGGRWPSPSDLPAFRDIVTRYQQAVLAVAADMLRALAAALDLAPTFFADRMRDPQCFLRMFHYESRLPATANGEPVVLTDPHTDYGLITLLATDGVAGLEVRPLGGDWTMVAAPARSLIVNLGDMLARWTNDRYVSTPHRVSAPLSSDRYSVPLFVNPDPTTIISCLPACVSIERPCRYQPVTASEFLAQRIADGGYMRDARSDGVAPR